jgi:hypothetical protein
MAESATNLIAPQYPPRISLTPSRGSAAAKREASSLSLGVGSLCAATPRLSNPAGRPRGC